ncbi:hypothetical protein D1914_25805 [Salmonella enterica]|nr:hypothetical protein [Salmonella enterica]EAV0890318.1 hypothetical protein [Salmonella enterica]EBJ3540272.1 hypothetical protein [Salmonella enterica]EBL1740097.1 hypothetical protein [Salmonella enterica]ECI3668349.1 hypothetical protein [Salmonella enterica subsp. diarizonae]
MKGARRGSLSRSDPSQKIIVRFSAFKPVMIAAIDLYQFARTRTPVTWLRDPCGAELQADITIEPLQR